MHVWCCDANLENCCGGLTPDESIVVPFLPHCTLPAISIQEFELVR